MNRFLLSAFLALALVSTTTSTPEPLLGEILGGSVYPGDLVGNLLGSLLGESNLVGNVAGNVLEGGLGGNLVGNVAGGGGGNLLSGLLGGGGLLSGVLGGGGGGNLLSGLLGGLLGGNPLGGLLSGNLLGGLLGSNLLGGLLGGVGGTNTSAAITAMSIDKTFSHFEILCKLIQRWLALFECYMDQWERMLLDSEMYNKLFVRTATSLGFTNVKSFKSLNVDQVRRLIRTFTNNTLTMAKTLFQGPDSWATQILANREGIFHSFLSKLLGTDAASEIIRNVLSGELVQNIGKTGGLLGIVTGLLRNLGLPLSDSDRTAASVALGEIDNIDPAGLEPLTDIVGSLVDSLLDTDENLI